MILCEYTALTKLMIDVMLYLTTGNQTTNHPAIMMSDI